MVMAFALAISISELFPSVLAFIAFYVLWFIWFFFEMIFSWIAPFGRSRGNIVFDDMGSTVLIVISSLGCLILIYYLSANGILLLAPLFTYLGIALFAVGMLFRFWAILVLGRYFSPIVGIYKNHAIVTAGPYRYVRHPSYSGALLMLFSYGILLRSLIGSIVIFAVMLIVYLYRIKVEEKGLVKRFGNAYINYAKNKKKILPRIL